MRQSIAYGVFSTFCAIETGLSPEEKKRFLEIVVDEAAGRVCVGFPLQGDSGDENIALLDHADAIGASHAMVSYPQNLALTDEDELVAYHQQILAASDLAIVLFHNDKFALHDRVLVSSCPPQLCFSCPLALGEVAARRLAENYAGLPATADF